MKSRLLAVLPALLLSTACAERRAKLPTTESPLDLERVVLYRNGIGYFERHGTVDENVLRIRVRRDQVDDLLKSLTVIDENGRALSVSMPLDPESWANAALATLGPGRGSLAEVLDGLRGTEVIVHRNAGKVRGRIVMVERVVDEPDPDERYRDGRPMLGPSTRDHKVTLLHEDQLRVVRLSKVQDITLLDGDLALQLHRRLDASAGEGMFQQVEVAIRLAGKGTHDLRVSYVVAAPMWKPTYRVVLPEQGKGNALLQGWAVVDNTSGEDWNSVDLSLTSGEPIAFEYDLHTPRTVDRADLTEAGVRKQARVAVGETTWTEEEAEEAEEVAVAAAERDYAADEDDGDGDYRREASKRKVKDAPAKPAPVSTPMGGAVAGGGMGPADNESTGVTMDALRASTQASAQAKQVSGQTRFELQDEVTVPNGSSTMVAILNHDVDAEQTFLYRPGGAGYGYESNPYRVVRFKNTTGFVLEPGPISIYAGQSFVGEGLSEAVGTATSATIPFAVEPSILVTSSMRHHGGEMHILRIVRGVLEVENFSRTETTWRVTGRDKGGYEVLVRQTKAGGNYEIKDPPKGTETLPNAYLIPVAVPKGKLEGELKVVEETPSRTTIQIWDGRAIGLLEKLLVHADVSAEMRKKLQPVVDLRREIGKIDTTISGLQEQKTEADQRLNETRQNLEAIKKDPAATALRKKLSTRMDEFAKQGDALSREIVELQSKRLEKKIELEDLLENLDLRAPASKK